MSVNNQVQAILSSVLNFSSRTQLTNDSPLLGAIPEFDSMAVINIITSLEDHFGIIVEDDEIDASVFETVGSLVAFVESKL